MTLPATSEKRLQLVPNSYERGMPETTPMAKDTAKILVQNRASVWKWWLAGAPPEHQERGDERRDPDA